MAAVGVIQQIQRPPQPVEIDIQPNAQGQRVSEASRGIFDRMKETAVRIWTATVIGFSAAGDKISFVFFRALEWIHPSLGPKLEVVFLRVTNIWQSIKDAWKAEEIRKQIEDLSVQNHELQARMRDYDQVLMQNGQLTWERNHFQQESHAFLQAKNFAEEALRLAQRQEGNIIAREGALGEQRDIVLLKNERLEQENQVLTRQRDEARQALVPFLEGNQQLQAQLAAAQRQVLDLQQMLPSHQEMNAQFALVADAIGKVPRFGRTGLDGGLETLLPLLNGQIAQAKEKLHLAKATVQPNSPAAIALQSFERIMGVVEAYLGQVTAAMQLHGHYQDPVDRLLFLQPIQAE